MKSFCVKIFFSFIIFIFTVFICEFISGSLITHRIKTGSKDYRIEADSYKENRNYAKQYFIDHEKIQTEFTPFGIWKNKKLKTQSINVNENGERFTYKTLKKTETYIWMFGGSTMFGTGSNDLDTIPSLLSKICEDNNWFIQIKNFGTTGHVHLQERQMMEELIINKKNTVPQMVIFLDGINDTFAAYQSGKQNTINNQKEIENKIYLKSTPHILFSFWFSNSSIFKIFTYINNGNLGWVDLQNEKNINLDLLSSNVLKNYCHQICFTKKMLDTYKVKSFFFWQPSIFSDKKKTSWEYKILKRKTNLQNLFSAIQTQAKLNLCTNAISIDNIFENISEPVWIDAFHTGPHGNKIIAERIWQEINKKPDLNNTQK